MHLKQPFGMNGPLFVACSLPFKITSLTRQIRAPMYAHFTVNLNMRIFQDWQTFFQCDRPPQREALLVCCQASLFSGAFGDIEVPWCGCWRRWFHSEQFSLLLSSNANWIHWRTTPLRLGNATNNLGMVNINVDLPLSTCNQCQPIDLDKPSVLATELDPPFSVHLSRRRKLLRCRQGGRGCQGPQAWTRTLNEG